MPDLYSFTRPPTLAETTKTEISDADVGLALDPVAQSRAEDFIKAAIAYRHRQKERAQVRRSPVTPITIRIALAADDDEAVMTLPDVIETMTPAQVRFNG